MNRLDLAVVIPDHITMDRAHDIGRHLEAAIKRAVGDLITAKIVESGELIPAGHQVVLSFGASGKDARLHRSKSRGVNGKTSGGVRGASVAGTERGARPLDGMKE